LDCGAENFGRETVQLKKGTPFNKSAMRYFIMQPGYPPLEVTCSCYEWYLMWLKEYPEGFDGWGFAIAE
jgi:hypothetical protein